MAGRFVRVYDGPRGREVSGIYLKGWRVELFRVDGWILFRCPRGILRASHGHPRPAWTFPVSTYISVRNKGTSMEPALHVLLDYALTHYPQELR